jgi:hypothetical protein
MKKVQAQLFHMMMVASQVQAEWYSSSNTMLLPPLITKYKSCVHQGQVTGHQTALWVFPVPLAAPSPSGDLPQLIPAARTLPPQASRACSMTV